MKTIADIFKKNGSKLTKLINQAQVAQNLEIIFHTALDSSFAKYCHVASFTNSELLLTVTNASMATKLRFAIPEIIKRLRVQPEFKHLIKIRYTITAPPSAVFKLKKNRPKLSSENEILWQKTLAELKGISKKGTRHC